MSERKTFKQFRDNVRCAILRGSNVVDRDDRGVIQGRRCLGFLLETPQSIGIATKYRR
jgi:hypothetical protein